VISQTSFYFYLNKESKPKIKDDVKETCIVIDNDLITYYGCVITYIKSMREFNEPEEQNSR
jgi:uncharacterized protein YozE (UPF0346 family)